MPVAAKTALATAAAIGGTHGWPSPPGRLSVLISPRDSRRVRQVDQVIPKIALNDHSPSDRDFADRPGRQSKDNPSFGLGRRAVGVDDVSAVDNRKHILIRTELVVIGYSWLFDPCEEVR